jgi:hypothetical protein
LHRDADAALVAFLHHCSFSGRSGQKGWLMLVAANWEAGKISPPPKKPMCRALAAAMLEFW